MSFFLLDAVSGALPSHLPTPAGRSRRGKLPHEASKIIYVRNLPYKISNDELYDIFGKFGTIQQIRIGNAVDTKGTAFVVYDDVFDAKAALDGLSGFNVAGRYLIALFYSQQRVKDRREKQKQREELEALRRRAGQY